MPNDDSGAIPVYLGVSLLSSAGLIYEVSLTRILDIAQGHHFSFFIVSTALLGIGISGSFLFLYQRSHRGAWSGSFLVAGPLGFSIAAISGYGIVNRLPFDIVRLAWEPGQIGMLVLAYGVLSVPFFFTGLTIVAVFHMKAERAGRVYFFDLMGGTAGALLPLVLYPMAGAAAGVVTAGLLGLASAALFRLGTRRPGRSVYWIIGTACGIILVAGYWVEKSWYEIRLSPYKGLSVAMNYPEARHVSTRWSVLSRIDVVESPSVRFAPGLSLVYSGSLPPQLGFTVDGDELHAVTRDDTRDDLRFLEYLPSAAPYRVTSPENVLVLRSGGGMDAVMAGYYNAPSIEVIAREADWIEVVREPERGFTTEIYRDPRVHPHVTEPRSFLASTERKFDLIVLPLTHALGASGPGTHGFSEDYTLTRESFAAMAGHLSKNGWLAVTMYLQPIPVQEARLAATLIETMENGDFDNPDEHLAVIRSWGTLTFLLKRSPLSGAEIQKLREFSEQMRFDLDYFPGITSGEANRFNRFPQPVYYELLTRLLDGETREELYRDHLFRIRPVTDDRPFFGYVLKLSTLKETYGLVREKWLFFVQGGFLLPVMLVQAVFLAGVFILAPVAFGTRNSSISSGSLGKIHILLYFLMIGVSFMAVEISMIQQMILLLGHPVYSVSLVLGAILLFAGVGSLISGAERLPSWITGRRMLLAIGCVLILEAAASRRLWPSVMGSAEAWRFAFCAMWLLPPGILMGMPFPTGIRHLKRCGAEGMIPWAWAVNGTASVVGAIFSAWLAVEFGFRVVLIAAALGYAAAAWCFGSGPPIFQPARSSARTKRNPDAEHRGFRRFFWSRG